MIPDSIAVVWFAFVFISEPIQHAAHHRLVSTSSAVSVGMTPDEVSAVLGKPAAEYSKRSLFATWWFEGPRPKQWMYGTGFKLDYVVIPNSPWLNPLPVNLRIAEYADEDLVIDWTDGDRVSAVNRPSFNVPEIAFSMLDSALFSRDVLKLFAFSPK